MSREGAVFRRFCEGTARLWRREWVRTGSVSEERFQLAAEVPCALCPLTDQAPQRGAMAQLSHRAKLFLPADTPAEDGMRVEVERRGKTLTFVTTGEPACYESHLEITVVREEWA